MILFTEMACDGDGRKHPEREKKTKKKENRIGRGSMNLYKWDSKIFRKNALK